MKYFLLSLATLLFVTAAAATDAHFVAKAADEILWEAVPLSMGRADEAVSGMERVRELYQKNEWLFRLSANRERAERARADLVSALAFAGSREDEAFRSALLAFCSDVEIIGGSARFSWGNVF